MTELEQATVNYFKAVLKAGQDILGHPEFQFRIEAEIGTRPEDAERGKMIGARIQYALDIAKATVKPLTIDGTTVQ